MYYFGCWSKKEAGHYLVDKNNRSVREDRIIKELLPSKIDGRLVPKENKKQGVGNLLIIEGWTVLALHDYSADSRPGSNSIFMEEGVFSKDEIIDMAKKEFPEQIKRILASGDIVIV